MPIGSVLGTNVSLHNLELLSQSFFRKSEHFQSASIFSSIMQKHSLIDLVKLLEDVDNFAHLLVPGTTDKINKVVFIDV